MRYDSHVKSPWTTRGGVFRPHSTKSFAKSFDRHHHHSRVRIIHTSPPRTTPRSPSHGLDSLLGHSSPASTPSPVSSCWDLQSPPQIQHSRRPPIPERAPTMIPIEEEAVPVVVEPPRGIHGLIYQLHLHYSLLRWASLSGEEKSGVTSCYWD